MFPWKCGGCQGNNYLVQMVKEWKTELSGCNRQDPVLLCLYCDFLLKLITILLTVILPRSALESEIMRTMSSLEDFCIYFLLKLQPMTKTMPVGSLYREFYNGL